MSAINTILSAGDQARRGIDIRDKWVVFLLAVFAGLGEHRARLRAWIMSRLDSAARDGQVGFRFRNGARIIALDMRQGDRADYLVGGELVIGGHKEPPFEPSLIVDGGANIGIFAVYAASLFPKSKLVCYEPSDANFAQLERNLRANDLDAETHKLGLWSETTTLYFRSQMSYNGYLATEPPGEPVSCTLPEASTDCWMKLDIEGSEYEVLPALFEAGHFPRWLSLEIHSFDKKGREILDLLAGHGYEIEGGDDPRADCANITAWRNADSE